MASMCTCHSGMRIARHTPRFYRASAPPVGHRLRTIAPAVAKQEMCVIVDENNNVVGAQPRDVTVRNRLLGRGSYVLVFNSRGELFVTKRSDSKDVYPGHLDVVISGVVNAGEEYEDTAARELCEEIGLAEAAAQQSLQRLFVFPYQDEVCHVWGCAFSVTFDGPISLQASEVDWGRYLPLDQVAGMMQRERFTPVGRHILQLYLQHQELEQEQEELYVQEQEQEEEQEEEQEHLQQQAQAQARLYLQQQAQEQEQLDLQQQAQALAQLYLQQQEEEQEQELEEEQLAIHEADAPAGGNDFDADDGSTGSDDCDDDD